MKTEILDLNSHSVAQSAQILISGELVSFPTETIYGLFGDATNPDSVAKIFQAKNRPADNPLIIHCADREDISRYATIRSDLEQLLIDKFFPGPFTLVLEKKKIIPDITTGGLDTVCVRIPDHVGARQIIRACGVALAGPSANLSGRPSPSSAKMVQTDMDTRIPLIIDGGRTLYGIESTVVKVEESESRKIVKILRPGFITREDIQTVVGDDISVVYDDRGENESPGSRYRHYSPLASVELLANKKNLGNLILEKDIPTALIASKEILEYHADILETLHEDYGLITMPLGSENNLLECAQSLYQLYASCDKLNIRRIIIQSFPEKGVGYALMNRIRKSIG